MKVHTMVLKNIIAALNIAKQNHTEDRQKIKIYTNSDGQLTIESYNMYMAVRKRVNKELIEDMRDVYIDAKNLPLLKAQLKMLGKNESMADITAHVQDKSDYWPPIDSVWNIGGDGRTFAFNVGYLSDILEALKDHSRSECVEVYYSTDNGPLLVTVHDADGAAILMPVKMPAKAKK
jgi:DNA polymerase III sliding clamp (beta) subunit (PCNA family)